MQKDEGLNWPGVFSHPSLIYSFNFYLLCTYVPGTVLSPVYIIVNLDRNASIIKFTLVWKDKQVIKIILSITKREV